MSERVQVVPYTVVASAVPWFGVERLPGTTGEYASRLDVRGTPQDPSRDPENEIVNPSSPANPAAARRAGTGVNASSRTPPDLGVPVLCRHGSVVIRGASLTRIDFLVESFRRGGSATLVAAPNPGGRVDVDDDERLVRRHEKASKYHLLQRRVPKSAMRFPERS